MSDNVQHWVSQMQHRGWVVNPEPMRIDHPLANGQWRLTPGASVRDRLRRRRMVRVSTLKYRARKRRR